MLAPYHTLNVASYFHCPIHAKVLSGGSVIKGDRGNGGQGFTSHLSRGLPQSQEDRFVIGLTLRWYCLFPKFARRFRVLRLSVPLVQSFAHLWPVSCCSLSCHSILCSSFVFFFLLRSLGSVFWCELSHPSELTAQDRWWGQLLMLSDVTLIYMCFCLPHLHKMWKWICYCS